MSVTILIDGQEFTGWTSYEVETSLLIPSDAFSLQVGKVSLALLKQLKPGKTVVVKLDNELVLTGQIDELQASQDAQATRLTVQGRDRMAALVDCSADPAWDWRSISLMQAAQKALNYLEIAAPVKGSTVANKVRQRMTVEPGESVWTFLERHGRQAGQLLWWSADGILQVGTPESTEAVYELRLDATDLTNVLSSNVRVSLSERFSSYRVIGQSGDFSASHKPGATVKDPEITAKRPLILVDSEATTLEACQLRATYERERRRAEGLTLEYVIVGHQVNGTLVRIGQTVDLYDALLGISGAYLVSQARYTGSSEDGHKTRIILRKHEALLAPVPATRKSHEVL